MGFTSDACWFLLVKTLLIKNRKKRGAALKNKAGGDEKRVFFTWSNMLCWVTLHFLSSKTTAEGLACVELSLVQLRLKQILKFSQT